MWNVRNWKVIFVFPLIVLISLLIAFQLTGVLHGPFTISEEVTLKPVKWEGERPWDAYFRYHDHVKAYSENEIRLTHEVVVAEFLSDEVHSGPDTLDLVINASATIESGFVSYVNITFWDDYEPSIVDFFLGDDLRFRSFADNMFVSRYMDYVTGTGLKAFIEFKGENQPKNVSIGGVVAWLLRSPTNTTNLIDVNIETVYYNGTVYKKIAQPFQLKIAPDNNNSFETAQEIQMGFYPRFLIGSHLTGGDHQDYFKIHLIQGQEVALEINATSAPTVPSFYTYVYNPERETVISRDSGPPSYYESIVFTANSTGYWFVEVRVNGSHGSYSLKVD
jgi:hypothetical protein